MRTRIAFAMALAILLAPIVTAGDEEMTYEGVITCAKCSLKMEDAKECQSVLVVEDEDGEDYYYLVDNDVAEEFGHVCGGEKPAVVTGTVAEAEDGKAWLTPTAMRAPGA